MKSKVTQAYQVQINGQPKTWQSQNGLMYFHFIQFEDGTSGEYMSKSQTQDKFIVGQEAEYEFTPSSNPQYPGKIKPVYEKKSGGRGGDPKSFAASYAKDIIVAYINNGHKVEQDWFTKWADYIHAWMEGKDVQPPKIETGVSNEVSDLPF